METMETPARRYPKRLKVGSPSPVTPLPAVQSADLKPRKGSCPVPSPQPPVLQSEDVKPPTFALPLDNPQAPVVENVDAKPRKFDCPVPSPELAALQTNGNDTVMVPSSDFSEKFEPRQADESVQELPPSSTSLNIPATSLADLFSVYSYLRCFSRLLFLSPFSLEKFVSALRAEFGDVLLDSVHLSLLEAVKRHYLATDPSLQNLGELNWDLLDIITWPVYLTAFLRTQGYSKVRKHSLVKAGLGRGDYQKRVPLDEKLAILSFLCDHALQSEDSRTEVSVRLMYAHQAIQEPALQRIGEGDTEWRPQEARAENKVLDTPLLRKVSDKIMKSAEKGEWSKEVQRAATALGGDGNSNDCMLCGMDGVLLCCDACPAAYHSRCLGIMKGNLAPGDWFCPECRLTCTGAPYSKRLQGAQLLGMGPQCRYFLATCDYLLVSEVGEKETTHWYYGITELPQVLDYLQSCGHIYSGLQSVIQQQWELEPVSHSESCSPECPAGPEETPPSSPGKASLLRHSIRKKKPQMDHETPVQESGAKQIPKLDGKGKPLKIQLNGEAFKGPYVNQYAHGVAVAAAANTIAIWQGGGDPAWVPGTRARGTGAKEQVRAFTQTLPSFTWPSNRKRFSEKCGWCGLCSSKGRGCLLVQTDLQVSRHVDDLKPLRISKGPHHLGTVAAYVLHLEQTLHAFLVGWPWESSLQRQRWRTRIEEFPSVRVVQKSLLQLEAALRPITVSTDWVKHADVAPLLWPACMLKRQALPWAQKEAPPSRECGLQWQRGGKVAQLLCDWETLPRRTLKHAARQGGMKPMVGVLYNDTNAVPQRTKQCAWRARVETASSVAQIGLQIRTFDIQLKWRELLADPDEDKKPFIYAKSVEADVTKYLVAMTEEEIEAEEQNMDTPMVGLQTSSKGQKQVWKTEQQLPLCQVKLYEEKLFEDKSSKANQGKKDQGGTKKRGLSSKRKSLNIILGKLFGRIKLEEKKLQGKKPQACKSPKKILPDLKKPEGRTPRPQCQRCLVLGEKAALSSVEGVLLCGECLQLRHGTRKRKPSAKILEMLLADKDDKGGASPTKVENGDLSWQEEAPPLKLQWNGTSLRKSGCKRKRKNFSIGAFIWLDPHDGSGDGSGVTEIGKKRGRLNAARD